MAQRGMPTTIPAPAGRGASAAAPQRSGRGGYQQEPPDTLPADFFDNKASEPPDTLPPGFFDNQNLPAPERKDPAWEYAAGVLSMLNPIPAIEGIASRYKEREAQIRPKLGMFGAGGIGATAAAAATGYDVLRGIAGSHKEELDKFWKAPTNLEAFPHLLAASVPVLGPQAAKVGEKIGSGEIARGTGEAVGMLAPFAASALEAVRIPSPFKQRLNPEELSAVQFGDRMNIPVDFATRSGNPSARGFQELVEASPGGAGPMWYGRNRQENALAHTLENEMIPGVDKARLGTQTFTQESSGQAVLDTLDNRIKSFDKQADDAYDQLRAIERDPANTRTVQVATEPAMQFDARGNSYSGTRPVLKNVAMPVDLRPVKTALAPIYERVKESMPLAQREADKGLHALEQLLKREDFIPASVADRDLSAIKGIVRKAASAELRNIEQGLAAKALGELSAEIDKAMAAAGPEAAQALRRGRALTKAKYETAEIMDSLPVNEPVRVFNKLVSNKDTAVNLLRDVRRMAPQDLGKIGRAWLEGALGQATQNGGFKGAAGLNRAWNQLGTETKFLLFKDKKVIQNLDDFFLLAQKTAERANPSRSALVYQLLPTGVLVYTSPVTGIGLIVSESLVAKMLMSRRGSQLLMDGMRVPVGRTATAYGIANQIEREMGQQQEPQQIPAPVPAPARGR